jgi:hypothetical protein
MMSSQDLQIVGGLSAATANEFFVFQEEEAFSKKHGKDIRKKTTTAIKHRQRGQREHE